MTGLESLSVAVLNITDGNSSMYGGLARQYDEDQHGTPSRASAMRRERCSMATQRRLRSNSMTLLELSDAVRKLVPDAQRVDVALAIQCHEANPYRKSEMDVLAEISVWRNARYYGCDAPTYEAALERFRVVVLAEMGLATPAPALQRLAAMDQELPCSTNC